MSGDKWWSDFCMDKENMVYTGKDGGLLQSEVWRHFQAAFGRETVHVVGENFWANGIVHELPWVGKYLYFPRGPVINDTPVSRFDFQEAGKQLVQTGKNVGARWLRIEPQSADELKQWQTVFGRKIVKAPYDVQPKEIMMVDITPEEETLLANMKPKTRYNIRLAEKRGVKVFVSRERRHQEAFLGLIRATTGRKGIAAHPRAYYENFFTVFPDEMRQLFVAEYKGEVVAANLVCFFGETATYLHGGSGDAHRDVMAPYLLQWEQMKQAKARGCTRYDLGGVHSQLAASSKRPVSNSWEGITKFKIGFAPQAAITVFPGTYDVALDSLHTTLYRLFQILRRLKHFFLFS